MGLTVRDLITCSRFCAIDRREYPVIYQGRKLKSSELSDILLPHVNDEVARIDFVLDGTALEIKFAEVEPESETRQEKVVENTPAEEAAPVIHAHWEDCSNGWMCSNCQRDSSHDTEYCPHCGAIMDEGVDDE